MTQPDFIVNKVSTSPFLKTNAPPLPNRPLPNRPLSNQIMGRNVNNNNNQNIAPNLNRLPAVTNGPIPSPKPLPPPKPNIPPRPIPKVSTSPASSNNNITSPYVAQPKAASLEELNAQVNSPHDLQELRKSIEAKTSHNKSKSSPVSITNLSKGLGKKLKSAKKTAGTGLSNLSHSAQKNWDKLSEALETPEERVARENQEVIRGHREKEAALDKQVVDLIKQSNVLANQAKWVEAFPYVEQAADLCAAHQGIQELPVFDPNQVVYLVSPEASRLPPSADSTNYFLNKAIQYYEGALAYIPYLAATDQNRIRTSIEDKLNRSRQELKNRPDVVYTYDYLEQEVSKGPERAKALLDEVRSRGTILDEQRIILLMQCYDITFCEKEPGYPYDQVKLQPNSPEFIEFWSHVPNEEHSNYIKRMGLVYFNQWSNGKIALKCPAYAAGIKNQREMVADPVRFGDVINQLMRQKAGVYSFAHQGKIPNYPTRLKMIESELLKTAHTSCLQQNYLDAFHCIQELGSLFRNAKPSYGCGTIFRKELKEFSSQLQEARFYYKFLSELSDCFTEGFRNERTQAIKSLFQYVAEEEAKIAEKEAKHREWDEKEEARQKKLNAIRYAYRPRFTGPTLHSFADPTGLMIGVGNGTQIGVSYYQWY